jgi:hypothetical protein
MVTTCFFCQNLLSDYIEGILPSSRHDELKRHLDTCRNCTAVHSDLEVTLDVLREIPSRPLSHDLALRITEASSAGRLRLFSRVSLSRFVLFLLIPVMLFFAAASAFPTLFPWYARWRSGGDTSLFVRYYPLLDGATEIIEEQANWLHVSDPFMRSVWEEGGLSPEEFEKTFQVNKTLKVDEK